MHGSNFLKAAGSGDCDTVADLIAQGIDVNFREEEGHGRTALIKACRHGHIAMVRLLLEKGARVDERDASGDTAPHYTYKGMIIKNSALFRGIELYEKAIADPETKKLLIIDRAPARRKNRQSTSKAPPPFYPDLLDAIPEFARIDLDLKQFLTKLNDFLRMLLSDLMNFLHLSLQNKALVLNDNIDTVRLK